MDPQADDWFVYILRCRDGSLYTGIARNPDQRLCEHNNSDRGAKYTRGRRPVRLVYTEALSSRAEALRREWKIKKLRRKEKLALIERPTDCRSASSSRGTL